MDRVLVGGSDYAGAVVGEAMFLILDAPDPEIEATVTALRSEGMTYAEILRTFPDGPERSEAAAILSALPRSPLSGWQKWAARALTGLMVWLGLFVAAVTFVAPEVDGFFAVAVYLFICERLWRRRLAGFNGTLIVLALGLAMGFAEFGTGDPLTPPTPVVDATLITLLILLMTLTGYLRHHLYPYVGVARPLRDDRGEYRILEELRS